MKLTIVIPIYNGFEHVTQLVEALQHQRTNAFSRALLIDDASTDARIHPFLAHLCEQDARFEFQSQSRNLGFVGTCNAAIASTQGDLVLLNSDTTPVEGWLDEIVRVAEMDPAIGIVCPLSDNATILTLFATLESEMRAELDHALVSRRVLTNAPIDYFSIPTAVGFCMFLRRTMLNKIGAFDVAFGLGYGEENDLSMRAIHADWKVVCAPRAYVSHFGSASFSEVPSVVRIRTTNTDLLKTRWPEYESLIAEYARRDPRWLIELLVLKQLSQLAGSKVILHQTHQIGTAGGVERYVSKILAASDPLEFIHVVLVPNPNALRVSLRLIPENKAWILETPASILQHFAFSNAERVTAEFRHFGSSFDAYFMLTIDMLRPDVFHVHHLLNSGSAASIRIARNAMIPVIYGIHDFFSICPNFTLTTPDGSRCKKSFFDRKDQHCDQCVKHCFPSVQFESIENDPYDYNARHFAFLDALTNCTLVYAPSKMVVDRIQISFCVEASRMKVIPINVRNGRRAKRVSTNNDNLKDELVIAHVGAFNRLKGADTFVAIKRVLDRSGFRAKYWIIGSVGREFLDTVAKEGILCSNKYSDGELSQFLSRVDIACCLSSVEETYGITVDEVINSGVQLVVTRWPNTETRLKGLSGVHWIPPKGHLEAAALIRKIAGEQQMRSVEDAEYLEFNYAQISNEYRALTAVTVSLNSFERPSTVQEYFLSHETLHSTAAGELIAPYRQPESAHFGQKFFSAYFASEPKFIGINRPVVILFECDLTLVSTRALTNEVLKTISTTWVGFVEEFDRVCPHEIAIAVAQNPSIDESISALSFDDCLLSRDGTTYGYRSLARFERNAMHRYVDCDRFIVFRSNRVRLRKSRYETAESVVSDLTGADRESLTVLHLDRCALARDDCRIFDRRRRVSENDESAWLGLSKPNGILVGAELIHFVVVAPVLNMAETVLRMGASSASAQHIRFTIITTEPLPLGSSTSHPRVEVFRTTADSIATVLISVASASVAKFVVFTDVIPSVATLGFSRVSVRRFDERDVGSTTTTLVDKSSRVISSGGILAGVGAEPVSPQFQGVQVDLMAPPDWVCQISETDTAGRHICMARRVDFVAWVSEHRVQCKGFRVIDEFGIHLFKKGMRSIRLEGWLAGDAPSDDTGDVGKHDQKCLYGRLAHDLLEPTRAMPNIHRFDLDKAATRAPRFFPRWNLRSSIPRLLVMPFDSAGSGYYRTHLPAHILRSAGLAQTFVLPSHTSGFAPSVGQVITSGVDTLLAHNPFHDYQLRALEHFFTYSDIKIVIGMDDLMTQLPSYNPYANSVYEDIETRIQRALKLADLVVFSTDVLQLQMGHSCLNSTVIPNFLDAQLWPFASKNEVKEVSCSEPKPRIGWAGAPQHSEDLELLRLAYGATFRTADWFFFGAQPWFAVDKFSTFVPMTSPEDYPNKLKSLRLDLGLAPLVDNPFNRAKGNQKALEYLACGSEVFAANLPVYQNLGVKLISSDQKMWQQEIETWIASFVRADALLLSNQARHLETIERYSSANPRFVEAWKLAITP
jgi:GT2 family glycosyltransferase